MQLNYTAIIIATLLQFIVGAVWYTFIFGKLWAKIHGFDKCSAEEQKEMMKHIMPLYGIQLIVTLVTTFVFALLVAGFPAQWNIYGLAGFFWIGFVMPTQASAVMFGGAQAPWVMKKFLIMAGGSLACLMAAAAVLGNM
ncbi:MAG: hypothetical protein RL094_810 [Candidatus Parcubacteria bacterium]|jgi:hypothetical protein